MIAWYMVKGEAKGKVNIGWVSNGSGGSCIMMSGDAPFGSAGDGTSRRIGEGVWPREQAQALRL